MKEEIIYTLDKTDVQTVAIQEMGRKLTNEEIEIIIDQVAENISWYDAIADAIYAKLKLHKKK